MRYATTVVGIFLLVTLTAVSVQAGKGVLQGAKDVFKERYEMKYYAPTVELPSHVYQSGLLPPRARLAPQTKKIVEESGATTENQGKPAAVGEWMPMTFANGTKYDCFIPPQVEHQLENSKEEKKKIIGKTLSMQLTQQLHQQLQNTCGMKMAGWWVYEFCWNKGIRQYHQDGQQITTEYSLGKGPSHGIKDGANGVLTYGESSTQGMFVSTVYKNGTVCDAAGGLERSSEVRILCLADDAPEFEPEEVETCKYVLHYRTTAACRIPFLQADPVVVQEISCLAVPAQASVGLLDD